MKIRIRQIGIILLASLIIGLIWNINSIQSYFKGEFEHGFFNEKELSAIVFISLPEAEDLFAAGESVFIDSRSIISFQEGHIPNAINIPFETSREVLSQDILSLPEDTVFVIYCDGSDCQSSVHLAQNLQKKGYKDLRVFFGGWMEWEASNLPVERKNDQ